MKRLLSRALLSCCAAVAVVLAVALAASLAGLRVNTSPSIPPGVYILSSKAPARGDYVGVCPPPSALFSEARARGYLLPGPCPGGYGLMLKVLSAADGDAVAVDEHGVWIGGRLWPSSAPKLLDGAARALPPHAIVGPRLKQGTALLMSERCERGFDARYFGALPSAAIVGTAVPLFTW